MGAPMRKRITIVSVIAFVVCCIVSSVTLGQQKLAQSGMKFLNVGTNARITAMGEAFTAVEGFSSSMFYNPACMARLNALVDVSLGQTKWIADINYNYASAATSPLQGRYGVIGVTVMSVDYGELIETIRANNPDGFLDVGKFSPSAFMIGIGYANALSDRFSVGGNVKYVSQLLGNSTVRLGAAGELEKTESKTSIMAFDLGILYRTGFKSLNFGMTVRNFSKEVKYEKEGFQLPLIFKIGLSMNVMDFFDVNKEMHSFLVAIEATHPRDYPEQLNVGGEYLFMQILALRAGYMFNNDEFGFTAGVGAQKTFGDLRLGVDYSYTPFGVFNQVHRISVEFSY